LSKRQHGEADKADLQLKHLYSQNSCKEKKVWQLSATYNERI